MKEKKNEWKTRKQAESFTDTVKMEIRRRKKKEIVIAVLSR